VSADPGGVRIGVDAARSRSLVPFDTPLYAAGIDEGDVVVTIDGGPASIAAWRAIGARPPGSAVAMSVRRRDGRLDQTTVVVGADPHVRIEPIEAGGGQPTAAQLAFRRAWLATRVR
jgi:predicted metalloprotease with PDZ domain